MCLYVTRALKRVFNYVGGCVACLFTLIVLCLNLNMCSITRTFAQVLTIGGRWLSHERMWQPATSIEARSRDHCYYSLGYQACKARAPYYVVYGNSRSTVFFHIIS